MGFEAELRAPTADTFETFLREWYGDEAVDVHELPAAVPARLRRFYELFGKHETVNLHLVPPGELEHATNPIVFAVEEQGVFAYASGRESTTRRSSAHGTSSLHAGSGKASDSAAFLLQYALYEAALGSRRGGWGLGRVGAAATAGRTAPDVAARTMEAPGAMYLPRPPRRCRARVRGRGRPRRGARGSPCRCRVGAA